MDIHYLVEERASNLQSKAAQTQTKGKQVDCRRSTSSPTTILATTLELVPITW